MRVALHGCLSVLNVFLHILHQAFFAAISGNLVSPDIQAENLNRHVQSLLNYFPKDCFFRHIQCMFFFRSKRIFLTNIKTNKCFQNGVNFILFIDCFMFVTLEKIKLNHFCSRVGRSSVVELRLL